MGDIDQTQLIDLQKAKTEAVREIKHVASSLQLSLLTMDDYLNGIPKILEKVKEIHDRLELIEQCLKDKGLLEEHIDENWEKDKKGSNNKIEIQNNQSTK